MKLVYMTTAQFFGAIFVGVVLAIVVGFATVPHVAETSPVVITPAPTPAPVYVQPAQHPASEHTDLGGTTDLGVTPDGTVGSDGWGLFLSIMVVLPAVFIMALTAWVLMRD